jgi:hypothetical protein
MEQDNDLSDAEKGQVRVQLTAFPPFCSSMRRQAGLTPTAKTSSPCPDHESNKDSKVLDSPFLLYIDLAQTSL